jgi:hypothetical protein
MAKSYPLQTSFSAGVLSPGLAGSTDLEQYYRGAARGLNVLFQKEGGARGRWGLQHIADIPEDGRLLPFSFNTEQNYLLALTTNQIRFFRNDALIEDINAVPGQDYLPATLTLEQCLQLDHTQSADTLILAHEDVATQRVLRVAAHATWSIAAITLSNLPVQDFNDADSPSPTNHRVDVTFTDMDVGKAYKLALNGNDTPEIIYAGSSTAAEQDANERRIAEELLGLPDTGTLDSGITVAFQSGTTYRITFSGDSADAYEPMSGRAVDDDDAVISFAPVATGVPRREVVISATRGYPSCVFFYEGRLLLGGLEQLPQSILGTKVGAFNPYNFKLGKGQPDEGIFTTLLDAGVHRVRQLFGSRALQVYTAGSERYAPDRPIGPTMALPPQTNFGIAPYVKPVEVDGVTIFATRDGKTLRRFIYDDQELAYNTPSVTALADHLINAIRSLAAQLGTATEEQNFVLVVNGDGTAAVLNTLRAQDLDAWAEMRTRTGDLLRQVVVVGSGIYFLVTRARNGATVHTLEKATFDTRLDASKKITSGFSTAMGGFEHLAGETVDVLVDGAPIGQKVVSAGGVITLSHAPTTSIEAGYFEPPILTTMPLQANIGGVPLLGATKSLSEIRVRVKESLGIVVNNVLIPDKIPGTTQTATPDTPVTGILKADALGSTDGDATITITQRQPLPFHVMALAAVLNVTAA